MTNHSSKALEQLGLRCIRHLEKESTTLRQFVEVSYEIRNVLGTQDAEAIKNLKVQHQEIESIAQTLNRDRNALRSAIGAYKGNGESGSIRDIENDLPEDLANQISAHRQEINNIVENIKSQTLANTSLLQQSIDIYQRLIVAAMGQSGPTQTYLPSGQLSSNLSHINTNRS